MDPQCGHLALCGTEGPLVNLDDEPLRLHGTAACGFLAEPISSLTGQTLVIDGGSQAVGCHA